MQRIKLWHSIAFVIIIGMFFSQSFFNRFWQNLALIELNKVVMNSSIEDTSQRMAYLNRAEKFSMVALQNQENPRTHFWLGEIAILQHDIDKAVAHWTKTNLPLMEHITRVRMHHYQGLNDWAWAEYQTLSVQFPKSSLVWYYKGNDLRKSKLYTESIQAYNTATALNDFEGDIIGLSNVYFQKGNVLRQQRKSHEAYKLFLKAIELNQFDSFDSKVSAYYRQGEMLLWMNRNAESKIAFEKVVDFNPEFYHAYSGLGMIAYRKYAWEEAESYWLKTLSIEPRYLFAHLRLARLYHDKKQIEKAIYHYQEVLAVSPNHEKAHQELELLLTKYE